VGEKPENVFKLWVTRLTLSISLNTRPKGCWVVRRTRPYIHKLCVPAQNIRQQVFYNPTIEANAVGYKIPHIRQSLNLVLLPYYIHASKTFLA
jgi:hypothetical protein